MKNPTSAQNEAITYRDGPAIVSAGAGSGKTEVLTRRLLQYVTDGEDIDRFVVITFTKSAAEELKTRIAAALRSSHQKRQAELVSHAPIGTIHSFCASILRENAQEASVNPDFRILSEERCAEMKAAAADRIMDERYEHRAAHPGFEELLDTVSTGRSDSALTELMLDLYAKMQSHAEPEAWAERCLQTMETEYGDLSETIWYEDIRDSALQLLTRAIGNTEEALAVMQSDATVKERYEDAMVETAELLRSLVRKVEKGWDETRACLPPCRS